MDRACNCGSKIWKIPKTAYFCTFYYCLLYYQLNRYEQKTYTKPEMKAYPVQRTNVIATSTQSEHYQLGDTADWY